MSGVSRWREPGHLERAVETAGGQEAFDAASATSSSNWHSKTHAPGGL
jgi:hypothetical protein